MTETAPSLLLVKVKQEELITKEGCVLERYKRRCSRPLPYCEIGSSETDYASSGDGWQPPRSPTSSTLSNEDQTSILPPSTVASEPASKLNANNSAFEHVTGLVISSSALGISFVLRHNPLTTGPIPKHEREDPSVEKYSDDLQRQRDRDLRAYTCDVCGKAFRRPGLLNRHIDFVHKGLRPYTCEICDRGFGEMVVLRRHINRFHDMLQEHTCEICGKAFAAKGTVNKHVTQVHKGRRPYACEICGINFKETGHLKSHIDRVHKNLREHNCGFCDKAFSTNHDLKDHVLRIHQNLREHSCALCGKAFAMKLDLTRHVDRVHKDLREHNCGFCDKAFVTKWELKQHVGRVHNSMTCLSHLVCCFGVE